MEATQHSDLAWIQTNIFSRSCVFSSCHDSTAPEEDLELTSAMDSRDALVDVFSVQQTTLKRVAPGDPSASYLMIKLGRYDQTKLMGDPMPQGSPDPLCSQKLDALERWITAGASE